MICKLKMFDTEYEVDARASEYSSNRRLAVVLYETGGIGEVFGILTVNLSHEPCPEGHAYIDTNNIPGAEKFIRDNKLGEFTGEFGFSGFCSYPLYRMNVEKMKGLEMMG